MCARSEVGRVTNELRLGAFVVPCDRVYLAQIVRLEFLENGHRGIAIRLLSSIDE
jgi:hypothetical protein